MVNTGMWTKPRALQCLEIMTMRKNQERNKKETAGREKGKPGECSVLEAQ